MTTVVGAAIVAVAIVTAVRPRAAVVAAMAMTSEHWLASALTIILMNENQGRREMIDQPVCFVGSIDII